MYRHSIIIDFMVNQSYQSKNPQRRNLSTYLPTCVSQQFYGRSQLCSVQIEL